MNKQVTRVAKTVRTLLEDEGLVLSERDRELLEDCYLTLERIAIKRSLEVRDIARGAVVDKERHPIEKINTSFNGVEIEYEGQVK